MRWILKADPVERKFFYPNHLINEMKVALGAVVMRKLRDFDLLMWLAEHHPPWWLPLVLSVAALIIPFFK